jgi:four helix bundle protein
MTKIIRFEDLECWQQARLLVREIYEISKGNFFSKDYRLVGQIQGAAISVMANISEGFIRKSDKEFIQFLFIALSSAAEVQSHLYVALDQGYINEEDFNEIYLQAEKIAKLISSLIKYLRSCQTKPAKRLTDQKTKSTK